jgi:hypothetical protein
MALRVAVQSRAAWFSDVCTSRLSCAANWAGLGRPGRLAGDLDGVPKASGTTRRSSLAMGTLRRRSGGRVGRRARRSDSLGLSERTLMPRPARAYAAG